MKKYLKYFTLLFLCLSPVFDTTFFYSRITSLIRVIIILLILFLTLILYKDARKSLKYLIPYYLLCIIFLIIDFIHSKNFISLFPGNFNYSFFSEALTVLKLMMPISLIYSLYYQKLNKKDYLLVFNIWTILICLSVIITNLFKISLSSYDQNNVIKYNILQWSKNKYYIFTASKGFFNYANQEALILILLLIINIYNFIKDKKYYLINIFLCLFTCLILGTRVSSMGGLLVFTFVFISYFIFVLLKKEKYQKHVLILLVPITIWTIIIPISPYSNRQIKIKTHNKLIKKIAIIDSNEEKIVIKKEKIKEISDEIKIKQKFIDEYVDQGLLPAFFYKQVYSYNYDVDFWYKFVRKCENKNINYRLIEISIIKRVKMINNNFLDHLFGISNSRIQNIVNIERDFILHYYAFGIIGSIILLVMYPLLLIKLLINFLKQFSFDSFIKLALISIFIFCAYLTGNVINSMTTIIAFGTIGGYSLLKEDKRK